MINAHLYTHTHTFNGPFSGTTQVSWYQKGKTNLDFTETRDSECQWHQLGHMQVCTSLQTDNHASTPPLSFFTGQMPFLPPNQQRQSTEGTPILLQFLTFCLLSTFFMSTIDKAHKVLQRTFRHCQSELLTHKMPFLSPVQFKNINQKLMI